MAISKREKVSVWSTVGVVSVILSIIAWTMFPIESASITSNTRQVGDTVSVSDENTDDQDELQASAQPVEEQEPTSWIGFADVPENTGDPVPEDASPEPADAESLPVSEEMALPAEPAETGAILECSVPDSIEENSMLAMSAILFDTDLQPLASRTVAWSISPGGYNFTSVTQSDGTTELVADISDLAQGQYGVSAVFDADSESPASCAESLEITDDDNGSHRRNSDVTKPALAITSPMPGDVVDGPSSGVMTHVTGISADDKAGVKNVEVRWTAWWGLTGYRNAAPLSPGDWSSWSYDIEFNTDGPKSVLVKSTDGAGNKSWKLTTFDISFVTDDTKPVISITAPAQASEFEDSPGGVTVHVTGTASDFYTGVQTVEVRTDSAAYVQATPDAPGDWSSWYCDVTFATSGPHQITARVTDNAGNTQWQTIDVTVLPSDA